MSETTTVRNTAVVHKFMVNNFMNVLDTTKKIYVFAEL